MSEEHSVDIFYLGPPAPHCICQKDFLLPTESKVPLLGPLGRTTKEDHSLCAGSTMLG